MGLILYPKTYINRSLVKRAFLASLLALALFLTSNSLALAANAEKPKNVILLIGDGMGEMHVTAARIYNKGELSFEAFPCQGYMTTYAYNYTIPDSAAAGTSIATARKVNNSVVSLAIPIYRIYEKTKIILDSFRPLGGIMKSQRRFAPKGDRNESESVACLAGISTR